MGYKYIECYKGEWAKNEQNLIQGIGEEENLNQKPKKYRAERSSFCNVIQKLLAKGDFTNLNCNFADTLGLSQIELTGCLSIMRQIQLTSNVFTIGVLLYCFSQDVEVKWIEYQNMVNYLIQWIRHHATIMSDRAFPNNPVELKVIFFRLFILPEYSF